MRLRFNANESFLKSRLLLRNKPEPRRVIEQFAGVASADFVTYPIERRINMVNPAWPSGMVNRRRSIVGSTFIIGESDWAANVNDLLKTKKLTAGIAIESTLNGNDLTILSHVKIQTATDDG